MNKSNRPSWDLYFLDIAATVAMRSPCVKRQVGAVLVSEDRAILATGYNGPPRGAPHRDETTCVRIGIPSGERADVVCCAHAEINAIAQAARHGVAVKGSTLYVTTSPCAWCARSIVNAGVVRVVREGDYNDPVALNVFAESSVHVVALVRVETVVAAYDRREWSTVAAALPALVAECRAHGEDPRIDTDVAKLAACMSLPDGAGMAEISTEIQKHKPWNGKPCCDVDADRIEAQHQELLAVHDELGSAHDELASMKQSRDNLAEHSCTITAELSIARNERDAWAFKASATQAKRALEAIEMVDATRTRAARADALHDEIQRLEAWVEGKGSLGDGRVSKAVLKYANDHEKRVLASADEKHRKLIDAVGDLAHASGIAWADADDATALGVLDALVTGEASMTKPAKA